MDEENETAQRLDLISLLLNRLRADPRTGQDLQALTPEQRTALASAEDAIETYVSFYYAPDARP